jgi:hypothetical protein
MVQLTQEMKDEIRLGWLLSEEGERGDIFRQANRDLDLLIETKRRELRAIGDKAKADIAWALGWRYWFVHATVFAAGIVAGMFISRWMT